MYRNRKLQLLRHRLGLHFSVFVDVLLIAIGLFGVALLSYTLPTTLRSVLTGTHDGFVVFAWNATSLIAIAAATGIAIFAPQTKLNRRRSKIWLMVLLVCQSILGLMPNAESMAFLIRFFWPSWLAVAALIVLLHIESRLLGSDWLAVAESLRKVSLKDRLKKGFAKLGAVTLISFGVLFVAAYAISLANMTRAQLASRSWPVTRAELVRCEMVDSINATWNSDFHLNYTFEVDGSPYTGNDYDIIDNKPTAIHFNAAKQTVEKLNSSDTLQVAFNPANPSQNLLHPGLTGGFALATFVGILTTLFNLVVFGGMWTHLATSRFTDPASVYRAPSRTYYHVYSTVLTIYICTIGFVMLAARAPIPTSLFAALMLFIAVFGSYCCIFRFTEAHSTEIVKQKLAGKTVVFGLDPTSANAG